MTQLIYFNTITSIVVWLVLLYCIYYFITKAQFKKKVEQLEKTWKNKNKEYHIDYKQREQEKDKMFDAYLIKNLKRSCFNCKTFDEKAKDDYFCVVDGQCPGIDLMKSQKIMVLNEKESWYNKIRRE